MSELLYKDYYDNIKKSEMNEELKKALCRISEYEHILTQSIKTVKENGGRVIELSDYDTDGVMSALILNQKYDIDEVRISDRYKDGYGIPNDLSSLKEGDLVILTDIGSDSIDKLKNIIDITKTTPFIIDHHELSDDYKVFITEGHNGVKPMVLNFYDGSCEKGKEPDYCSTGLCYRIALADKDSLSYRQKQLISTYMANGTIGDCVKVNSPYDTNREDILNGFHTIENMEKGFEPKFGYLLYATGLTERPYMTTEAIQYQLSPVTTLGKRMNMFNGELCNVGQKIFEMLKPDKDWEKNDGSITDEHIRTIDKLLGLNETRKREVKTFERKDFKNFIENCKDNIAIYVNDNIPDGYIGLIAMDIVNQLKRPALVFTKNNKGDYTASGRNMDGYPDILEKCTTGIEKAIGGHTNALGITVAPNELLTYINKLKQIYKDVKPVKLDKPTLKGSEVKDITVEKLIALEPFGTDFPKVEVENTIKIGERLGKAEAWSTIYNADSNDKIKYFGYCIDGKEGDSLKVRGTLSANYYKNNTCVMLTLSEAEKVREKHKEIAKQEDVEKGDDEYER